MSVGALGGVPLIDRTTGGREESRPYTIGPSIEVRFPGRLALEADALYQRLGNSFTFQLDNNITVIGAGIVAFAARQRANVWEFPFLGKYYFRPRTSALQPFIGTGWAFRVAGIHESGKDTTVDSNGVAQTFSFQDHFRSDAQVGATFAAGFRYRISRLDLLPQVRYTRWGGSNDPCVRTKSG